MDCLFNFEYGLFIQMYIHMGKQKKQYLFELIIINFNKYLCFGIFFGNNQVQIILILLVLTCQLDGPKFEFHMTQHDIQPSWMQALIYTPELSLGRVGVSIFYTKLVTSY